MSSARARVARLGIIALLFAAFGTGRAQARWATVNEADWAVASQNSTFTVKADGTFESETESTFAILKESGKERRGVDQVFYDPAEASVKVLEAKTINGYKSIAVSPERIEDKSVANGSTGFTKLHQITVAYPALEVGSKTFLKYVQKTTTPVLKGVFAARFIYGTQAPERAGTVTLVSERPLRYVVNDPERHLEVVDESAGRGTKLRITLVKPVYRKIVEEGNASLPLQAFPRVDVSTAQSWSEIAKPLAAEYEKLLAQPLPGELDAIVKTAQKGKTSEARVAEVISRLARKLTYLGDWRTARGKYVPRPLAEIARDKSADCKDYTLAAVAMLRSLGMTAQPALIWRGNHSSSEELEGDNEDYSMPSLAVFNHAVVRVALGDKVLWVDPTNPVATTDLFEDLSARHALVLAAGTKELELTPAVTPESSKTTIAKRLSFGNRSSLEGSGSIELSGRAASTMLGTALRLSKEDFEQLMLRIATSDSSSSWASLEAYNVDNNVAHDLRFAFKYGGRQAPMRTTAGSAFVLPGDPRMALFVFNPKTRVSDLVLGSPSQVDRRYTLAGLSTVGDESLDCWIVSKWVDASRTVKRTDAGLEVLDSVTVKAPVIRADELHGNDFEALQSNLAGCFASAALVYQPKDSVRGVASAAPAATTTDLYEQARAILSRPPPL
ncbi:MAG: DUF3857 domain-containing transglutaminase family protein, partial [Deltaproteobacteria bacterium]|nr:DUF3857 domain-containing transglutaminase family protein [Deltaproteobacteria bacterium]